MTAEPIARYHPPVPAAPRLDDVDYKSCESGKMICLTPEEARTEIANKVRVGVFIDKAMNVIRYYRLQD
ncbi:hypothetical protein [Ancylobacter rudongensis]|uniref:Uncharacterized protein n=1 Tax=Ancylobacter rudongensis TaxID=177413 RepID=A0A1G4UPV8_9HYPH|nr:hypothetical protein [Ancylobacter rudongensis]SCW95691.1 hypothetical protein SAMN05660859_0093 [Ancylobacter rudongensis]